MLFTCICCKRVSPDVKPSKSHILPESLGSGPILKAAVCADCNHRFSRDVEQPLATRLAPLRNLLQIKGKRGDIPAFRGTASFLDVELPNTRLQTPSELEKAFFCFHRVQGETGKKEVIFVGDPERLSEAQRSYEAKHPGRMEWSNLGRGDVAEAFKQGVKFHFELDFTTFVSQEALRLATKIAFEFYCRQTSAEVVLGPHFDAARDFVSTGKRQAEVCRVVIDPLMTGLLNTVPFPFHHVYLDRRLRSDKIIAIVGLFGLIQYASVLTHFGGGFGDKQELHIIPLHSDVPIYTPTIWGRLGSPDVHGRFGVNPADPAEALPLMCLPMLKKLNAGIKETYEQMRTRLET